MSIQSSMNALLGATAVIGHLAQPQINAYKLSKEEAEQLKQINAEGEAKEASAQAKYDENPTPRALGEYGSTLAQSRKSTITKNVNYIRQLEAMHRNAPGDYRITNKLNNAKAEFKKSLEWDKDNLSGIQSMTEETANLQKGRFNPEGIFELFSPNRDILEEPLRQLSEVTQISSDQLRALVEREDILRGRKNG